MTDYSQNGEQRVILEAFGGFVGNFLEIGACDGKLVSNTLALVERGWSGVMVEPSPRAFMALHERHGNNPKLTLVHAAVSTGWEYGFSEFWDESTIGGYSTTEESNRAKWQHLAKFPGPFWLPTIPMSAILSQFGNNIDFLSIDTEGTSTDLFLEFPFGGVRPNVVCVEHDGRIDECLTQAHRWKYREMARNGENLVFVHESPAHKS